jgi:hypothetical protein
VAQSLSLTIVIAGIALCDSLKRRVTIACRPRGPRRAPRRKRRWLGGWEVSGA